MNIYDLYKIGLIITINYLVYVRITVLKIPLIKKLFIGLLYIFIFTVVSLILSFVVSEPYKTIITVFISSVFFAVIEKRKLKNIIFYQRISFAVSFTIFFISITVSAIVFQLLFEIHGINIGIALFSIVLEIIFVVLIYKIRFKIILSHEKGLSGIGGVISGTVLIIYSISREENLTNNSFTLLFLEIILCSVGMFYWLKRESIIEYNRKLNSFINKKLKTQIDDLKNEIEQLNEIRLYLEKTVHTDNKKLPAYQEVLEYLIKITDNPSVKEKSLKLLGEIKTAKQERFDEASQELRKQKILPSTGMELLDAVFRYYNNICIENNIDFDLMIKGDLNRIIITQSQLETIISNLLDNAINAIIINDVDCDKNILIQLLVIQNDLRLSVEDSGIPFKNSVISNLKQCKETILPDPTDGCGIGFVTIFEIINKYKASIEITEKHIEPNNYKKIIVVHFDGKNRIKLNIN